MNEIEKQEKLTPEGLAAAIFIAMTKKIEDIKMISQKLSTMNNCDVELELKFLKAFSTIHLIITTIKDDTLRDSILKAFHSFFFSKSSDDYFGCQFKTISEKFSMRIDKYFDAIDEPNPRGPHYSIGKQFSRFIGYENSAVTTYHGALFFASHIIFLRSVLDDILKEYKFG